MTRVCIPQSNSVSPVIIKASHWEKYLGDILTNYIKTGFTLSAGTGLTVNIASGKGYIGGIEIESDATDSNQLTLTANTTNYIYAVLTRDGSSEPSGWGYSSNTTGVTPTDGILLGTATTNGTSVTATSATTTQQGLAFKNFAVNTISAIQGQTAITISGDLSIGANKIKTTNLMIKELSSTILALRNTADSVYRDLRIAGFTASNVYAFNIGIDDAVNYEKVGMFYSSGFSAFVVRTESGGTGVSRPLKLQVGGVDSITINTDSSVNAHSRAWSNLKLGGSLDANSNDISKVATFYKTGTDSNNIKIVSGAGTAPNQQLHFVADYVKQVGATSADMYFGYNSQLSTIQFRSAWTGTNTTYLMIDAANGLITFGDDVAVGTNKINTGSSGASLFASALDDDILMLQSQKTNNLSLLRVTPNAAGSAGIHSGVDIFRTDIIADSTNFERLQIQSNSASSGYVINVNNGGTGSLRTLKLQMGGSDIITLNTNNSVDANSRAWSNFVLGSNLDAGGFRLTKALTLHFDPTNVDTDSTIMGSRASTLSICATANGTVGQSISLRTSSVVTAGAGTPLTRLSISGGASTTNVTISNANLQLNTNKFYMNASTVYMSYWGGVDADIAIVRTDTTNGYSGLYVIPNGTPSSTVARIAVNMLDVSVSNANRSRIELLATASAGVPQSFALAVTNAGTGSLYPFKIQMSTNDVITFNTDNSMNFNSRAVSNFKLGGLMDGGAQKIYDVVSIYMSSTAGDDPGTGFLAGLRTANLGIMSAADGTTAREIRLYTQNAVTAGVANGVERLRVGAGVAQGSSLITSFEPFQFEAYQDLKVISAPSNPASGYGRLSMQATDGSNDDLYLIHKVATVMTSEKIATGMQGAGVLTYRQLKSNFMNVNSTGYIPVSGFDNATTSINTAASDVQMICPVAGTIKNLYFECYQFGFTLATLTVTVQKNGVDTALTTTCTTSSTVFSDTTHSFTVAAGDLLNIKVVAGSSGTGTAGLFMAAIQYVK